MQNVLEVFICGACAPFCKCSIFNRFFGYIHLFCVIYEISNDSTIDKLKMNQSRFIVWVWSANWNWNCTEQTQHKIWWTKKYTCRLYHCWLTTDMEWTNHMGAGSTAAIAIECDPSACVFVWMYMNMYYAAVAVDVRRYRTALLPPIRECVFVYENERMSSSVQFLLRLFWVFFFPHIRHISTTLGGFSMCVDSLLLLSVCASDLIRRRTTARFRMFLTCVRYGYTHFFFCFGLIVCLWNATVWFQ